MSGSSLDGLDIALADFSWATDGTVVWQLLHAETVPFSAVWQARLRDAPTTDGITLARTHTYFGHYLAELVNAFLQKNALTTADIDLISSHGHTVFHAPDRRFTLQIGCGAALAALTRCAVACDFRTQDIALFGEGTPLAPIADQYLFAGYDFYLNIGGIANISCNANDKFVAFDTSAANQILNKLAQQLGAEYDADGAFAQSGTYLPILAQQLNALPYLAQAYPKSLSNSWVQTDCYGIIADFDASVFDKLHTATVHIAEQVALAIQQICAHEQLAPTPATLLVTGGGAFNRFLMQQLRAYLVPLQVSVVVPTDDIINYKEALLMGVLGFLRAHQVPNTLSSVTGALRNTIGGAMYVSC